MYSYSKNVSDYVLPRCELMDNENGFVFTTQLGLFNTNNIYIVQATYFPVFFYLTHVAGLRSSARDIYARNR